jgi:RNA recognition motif-containing protein
MFKPTIKTTTPQPAQAREYKLFIGCIPGPASDDSILALLSEFGHIESLKLERRKNGKCSGYGQATVTSKAIFERLLKARPQFGDRQL